MINQKEVEVSGTKYLLTSFPATKGLKVMQKLIKLLGPVFMASGDNLNSGNIATHIFDNIDSPDVEILVKELVNSATKDTIAINFDQEFSTDYGRLFSLCREVVDFNFGNVFTLAGTDASQ